MNRRAALAPLAALALTGCFRTSVYSGLPPGKTDPQHDNQWQNGFVGGLVEASGSSDLARACPHGWAEAYSQTSFLHVLLQYVTLEIYSPQAVTVVCSAPRADFPVPSAGYRDAPAPADSRYPPAPASSVFPPPPPPAMTIE